MFQYTIRRLVNAVPLLIGVSIIGFGLMHLAPGGPLGVYTLNPTVSAQDIERIKVLFGLDQPMHVQYFKWASNMLVGNWGNTFFGGRPVLQVILERVSATLLLAGTSLAIAMLLDMAIGILGRGTPILDIRLPGDYLATTGAVFALSFPTFWFGLMAIYVFAL